MKILYYFLNKNTMMFQWQKFHIFDELRRYNCFFEIVSPLDFETIELANEYLISKIKSEHYDMFMTSFNEEKLYIDTLEKIKNKGIATLLFCPDNLVAPFTHKKIAKYFDLVWLTSKETEEFFKKWGGNCIFMPYAANPNFLVPNYNEDEILRIGFIGTPHGSRIDRINKLLNMKLPLTIHSEMKDVNSEFFRASIGEYIKELYNFSRYPIGRKLAYAAIIDKLYHRKIVDKYSCLQVKEPVELANLSKMNSKYAMMLAFSEANSTGILKTPVPIVNLRTFEIAMSGGIQLIGYTKELGNYFENEKEIILCSSEAEYEEKAKYYLRESKKEERLRIKMAARKRAENEHTWYCRFNRIFTALNLINKEVKY